MQTSPSWPHSHTHHNLLQVVGVLGDLPLERPTAMMDVESLVGIASMLDGWLPDVCQGVAPLVVTFVGLSMRPSTTHVSLEALEPVFARIEDIVTQQVRQHRGALVALLS